MPKCAYCDTYFFRATHLDPPEDCDCGRNLGTRDPDSVPAWRLAKPVNEQALASGLPYPALFDDEMGESDDEIWGDER